MPKPNLRFLLLFLLLLDTIYSFVQHLHIPLDGDLAGIVMPHEIYRKVLQDPLGLSVLLHDEVYNAPNRYFAHATLSGYFKQVPLALQAFLSPIDSVYVACALLKTITQLFLIGLLATYITRTERLFSPRFLVVAVLVTPLFHASGYNGQIGIISQAVTYTVFYAVPTGLLLLFFLPFYRAVSVGQAPRPGVVVGSLLLVLSVVLALNGPLVPPLALLICLTGLASLWWFRFKSRTDLALLRRAVAALRQIPGAYFLFFGFISVLCLYSFYIGLNNSENQHAVIPLLERYARLPLGLFYELTGKLGLPILLLVITLNVVLIRKQPPSPAAARLFFHIKCVGLVAVLYILLLPLGGYRDYRPYIIRSDTFQPVLLALFYLYGASTYYLLGTLPAKLKRRYTFGIVGVLAFYTLADKSTIGNNACERQAMRELASSPEKVVVLHSDCTIMRWGKITTTYDSEVAAELMAYWGITKEKKVFYQQTPNAW